jgi:hypothetical protein
MTRAPRIAIVTAYISGIGTAAAVYFVALEASGGWCISHPLTGALFAVSVSIAAAFGATSISKAPA